MRSFAELLTEYMDRTGISDAELARTIGVRRQTVFRWKEGLTKRPRHREDVLRCARRLRLMPQERDALLVAAGFPPEDDLTVPATAPSPTARPQTPPFLGRESTDVALLTPPRYPAAEPPVFVARERELAQLSAFLDLALTSHGQVVFVTGEVGIGKTALITEFARRAQTKQPDLIVAVGRGDAQTGIGDPYLPFREVLGLLTGDVEAKLVQGAITPENARRLWSFLHISGQALVECGPDLIDSFVSSGALAARVAARLAQRTGWLDQLDTLVQHRAQAPPGQDTSPSGELTRVNSTRSLAGSGQRLEQSHIFEQYTNVLKAMAVQQPLMLVVDDLQWADAASIGLLFRLGRSIGESRVLLVGAYRPADVALGRGSERHPLEGVVSELKRYHGDIFVDLGRADEAEGRHFVDAFLDTEPNRLGEGFRQALFRHTEGHPLFTLELLRDMQERGDLVCDEEGRWVEGTTLEWGALPARVEGVIEKRIGWLENELRELLSVASVEGEDFTAQVVARVQQMGERQLLRTLSQELEKRHRLVRELGEAKVGHQLLCRYEFVHTVFQQYLYNDLSAGERRLLHGEIAAVLEELYKGHTQEITAVAAIAVQLAHHYAEAGQGEKAVHYLLQAGDRARGLYAHREAIDHYQRALAFLKEGREYERAARTLMKLGLTHHIAFDFRRARQAYEEGFALWQRAGTMQPAVPLSAPHALRMDWGDPPTLDPTMGGDDWSVAVIDQLFSGLVELTPEMDVVPAVARTWEVSQGGRKYIFHLREDVVWSDGTAVTAGDFEYAWKRVLHPATEAPLASLLYDVKGARDFHQGEVSDPDRVAVRALDEVTLVVEMEGPTSYFPHLLACHATYPVPRHVAEPHTMPRIDVAVDSAGRTKLAPTSVGLVTNGPFRLEAWQPGDSMILVRNPEFHGQFTGNVERVELSLLSDWSARSEMYEAGDRDILELRGMSPAERDRARRRYAGEYVSGPELATSYVGFDVSRPPFDDPRVRRAFVLATDRESWADVVMGGHEFPATGGFVPPGIPGHSAGMGLPYDPDRARQTLAEAGYPGGRGFPAAEWLTSHSRKSQSERLLALWRENLGVELTEETLGWSAFLDRLRREPPHIFHLSWLADYPDPDNFLRGSTIRRHTRWWNEAYDKLVEEARRVTDQGERMQLYQEADRILIEEAVVMPLTYWRWHLLVKPWVRKYPTSAIKRWFWKDVVIEPH